MKDVLLAAAGRLAACIAPLISVELTQDCIREAKLEAWRARERARAKTADDRGARLAA